MDVKALGEKLGNLVDALDMPMPPPNGSSDAASAMMAAWQIENRQNVHREIRTLSQAILALEAVQRMTNPYVSPYADQSKYEWNNSPIQNVVDGDPA